MVEAVKNLAYEAGGDKRSWAAQGEVADDINLVHLDGPEVEAGRRVGYPLDQAGVLELLRGQEAEVDWFSEDRG